MLHYFLVSRVMSSLFPLRTISITLRIALIVNFVFYLLPSHCFRLQAFSMCAWWFFSGKHRMRVQSSSEFNAEVIGIYLPLVDDILYHIYIKTLRAKLRSPMIERNCLKLHNSAETCIPDDRKTSSSRKAVLEKKKKKDGQYPNNNKPQVYPPQRSFSAGT